VTTAHEATAVLAQFTQERTAARDTAQRVARTRGLTDYQVTPALREADLPASGAVTLGEEFDPELYNERGLQRMVERLTAEQTAWRAQLQTVVERNRRHLGDGAQEILVAAGVGTPAETAAADAERVITLSISVSGASHITEAQIRQAAEPEIRDIRSLAQDAGFTVHATEVAVRSVR